MACADRKPCSFSQAFNMTGQWSRSPSPSFHGFYNMTADCPPYAQDFDCETPQKSGECLPCIFADLPFRCVMPSPAQDTLSLCLQCKAFWLRRYK